MEWLFFVFNFKFCWHRFKLFNFKFRFAFDFKLFNFKFLFAFHFKLFFAFDVKFGV